MFIFDGYGSDTAKPKEEILTFDVPDDALRVLSVASQRASRNGRTSITRRGHERS
jgi:hypothetical protein